MPLHYALAYLAVLVVPVVVAIAAFVCARRGGVPAWAALAISFVGLSLSLVLVIALSWRCANSYDVVIAARTRLFSSFPLASAKYGLSVLIWMP